MADQPLNITVKNCLPTLPIYFENVKKIIHLSFTQRDEPHVNKVQKADKINLLLALLANVFTPVHSAKGDAY